MSFICIVPVSGVLTGGLVSRAIRAFSESGVLTVLQESRPIAVRSASSVTVVWQTSSMSSTYFSAASCNSFLTNSYFIMGSSCLDVDILEFIDTMWNWYIVIHCWSEVIEECCNISLLSNAYSIRTSRCTSHMVLEAFLTQKIKSRQSQVRHQLPQVSYWCDSTMVKACFKNKNSWVWLGGDHSNISMMSCCVCANAGVASVGSTVVRAATGLAEPWGLKGASY